MRHVRYYRDRREIDCKKIKKTKEILTTKNTEITKVLLKIRDIKFGLGRLLGALGNSFLSCEHDVNYCLRARANWVSSFKKADLAGAFTHEKLASVGVR